MSKISNRIEWIDGLKALAIFFIVLGHAINGDNVVWQLVYGFHVPLFIALSGITYHLKNESFVKYTKRKFVHIMIPYFIWGIISIIIYHLIGARYDGEEALTIGKSIKGLLWANGETGIMRWNLPLWFLPTFFIINIIAFFLEKYSNSTKKIVLIIIGETAIATLFYYSKIITNLPYGIETAIYLLPFFSYGKLISGFIKNKKGESKVFSFISIIGVLISGFIILSQKNIDYVSDQYRIYILFMLAAIIMITSLIGIFISIKTYHKYILDIGQSTLAIMILQKFPLIFFEKVCPIIKDLYITNRFITSCFIALFTIIMCMIGKKIIEKWFPWMLNPNI